MRANNIIAPPNAVTSDTYMTVNLNEKAKSFPILAIGRGSYMIGTTVDSGIDSDVNAGVHNLQIGRFCSLALNVTFLLNINHDYKSVTTSASSLVASSSKNTWQTPRKGQILLQNDVWVGANVTIMNGVIIHNGAVIAANSHVVKDVPPYAIVGGNPARVIKFRFTDEQIAGLLDISWWNWDNEKITRRKKDFSLPIDEFISKHRTSQPLSAETEKDRTVYLFFADFTEPYPIWEKVVRAYTGQFGQDVSKQLIVYLPDSESAHLCQKRITALSSSNGGNKESILVQIGQINGEAELFMRADCYITSRALQTVQRSCLADKFKVKILSGVDEPLFTEQNRN